MKLLRFLVRCVRCAPFWARYPFLWLLARANRWDALMRYVRQAPGTLLPTALRRFGASVGQGVNFRSGIRLDNVSGSLANLQIGNHCFIGHDVFVDLVCPVSIGDEAVVSADVMLLTHAGVGERLLKALMPRREGPVRLERGCWIGVRAVILPGLTIGEGAVVGAGAVVTQNVTPYTIVAGVPARPVRTLLPESRT